MVRFTEKMGDLLCKIEMVCERETSEKDMAVLINVLSFVLHEC